MENWPIDERMQVRIKSRRKSKLNHKLPDCDDDDILTERKQICKNLPKGKLSDSTLKGVGCTDDGSQWQQAL